MAAEDVMDRRGARSRRADLVIACEDSHHNEEHNEEKA
jgi:hypothetical protein